MATSCANLISPTAYTQILYFVWYFGRSWPVLFRLLFVHRHVFLPTSCFADVRRVDTAVRCSVAGDFELHVESSSVNAMPLAALYVEGGSGTQDADLETWTPCRYIVLRSILLLYSRYSFRLQYNAVLYRLPGHVPTMPLIYYFALGMECKRQHKLSAVPTPCTSRQGDYFYTLLPHHLSLSQLTGMLCRPSSFACLVFHRLFSSFLLEDPTTCKTW